MKDRRDIDYSDSYVPAMEGAVVLVLLPIGAGVAAWAVATRVLGWESDVWLWLLVGCAVVATICAELAFVAWLHEMDTAPRKKFLQR